MQMLESAGPEWLTRAFYAARTLPEEYVVESVRRMAPWGICDCALGVILEVEYTEVWPLLDDGDNLVLHTTLFVKLPLPPEDSPHDEGYPNPMEPKDRFAEINMYRLLEASCPVRLPRFYFGDICAADGKFILITEWVPLPSAPGDSIALFSNSPWHTGFEHLDLRTASVSDFSALVRAGAALAAKYRSEAQSMPEVLEIVFGTTCSICASRRPPRATSHSMTYPISQSCGQFFSRPIGDPTTEGTTWLKACVTTVGWELSEETFDSGHRNHQIWEWPQSGEA